MHSNVQTAVVTHWEFPRRPSPPLQSTGGDINDIVVVVVILSSCILCIASRRDAAEYTKEGLRAWRDGRGTGSGGGGRGTQWAVTVRLYWLRRGRRRQQCTTRDGLSARGYCRAPQTVSSRGGPPKTGERARVNRRRKPMDFRESVKPRDSGGGEVFFYCYPRLLFWNANHRHPAGPAVGIKNQAGGEGYRKLIVVKFIYINHLCPPQKKLW